MVICVLVTDGTDAFGNLERFIYKLVFPSRAPKKFSIKILHCSLCQTWWCCLVYLIATANFSLMLAAYSLFLAYMTPVVHNLLEFIRDLCFKITENIAKITGTW